MALSPIFKVYAREKGYEGGRTQEGLMVASGGAINDSQENLGVDIAGGQDKAKREGHAVGDRSRDIWGSRAGGIIFCDRDGKLPGGWRTPCRGCRLWV